jgi:hypothetical protein
MLRGDASQMTDSAAHNPMRYREVVEMAHVYDDMAIGRAARMQQAKSQYGQAQVTEVINSHPEYQGEGGRQKMVEHAQAAYQARMARGETKEQIDAKLNDVRNYSRANIEQFLALGREHLAKTGIEQRRARPPVPPVLRPGARPDRIVGGDVLAALNKRLTAKPSPKNAVAFLQAMRRANQQ